jgi:hypothetical protein
MKLCPTLAFTIVSLSLNFNTSLAAPTTNADPACEPIPGVESADISKVPFLVFGEMHGTAEVPEFVGQIVCVLSTDRPITLAIELSEREQPNTDAYLNSSGSPRDVRKLLQTGSWAGDQQWGVTSAAMLQLLEQVRLWRHTGRDIAVVHFQPASSGALHQDYNEIRMAALLVSAAETRPRALVVALMGNIHARKSVFSGGLKLMPAVAHLPAADVLTFNMMEAGGTAWQCRPEGCREFSSPPRKTKPKGLYRLPDNTGAFDGKFSVGSPSTASHPANSLDQPHHRNQH